MEATLEEQLTTVEIAKELGLLSEEYDQIKEVMGRAPNFTELSMYSVMWSEHCSYKNSIKWLKTLPKEGERMLAAAGEENAGLIDIGDGLACAFKIESHNHPSAIEPYQGAATGVGGIHRDIFTMGARPIATLNSLRFGNIDSDRTKWLIKGIVKGIGDYGNSFGIPTVGGEVYFDDCYNVNPLVNAMSVGIVKKDKTISATSYGEGNPVYIVGAATGKDGIHGATFASGDLTEDSADDLPAVQVGDPFQEKLLLEATQEAMGLDCMIGMQDMGAAGITCSTAEMSAKGEHGMIIHLDRVPTRQTNMEPFEMLLSESQERMLIVVKKGREQEIESVFEKWDIHCAIIGEVTKEQRLKYYMHDELVADVSAESLVLGGGTPVYDRDYEPAKYLEKIDAFDSSKVDIPENLVEVARSLVSNPNIASKHWVIEQYDSMVGTRNMVTNNPSDAALVTIKGTKKAIAMTTDCNSRYVHADPKKGTMIAVAEAARNVVCSGGEPAAITNCLNFGNPYNPEVYWQFVGAIQGMSEACRKFETPVTGGNVSFYNQSSDEGPVYPTPVIGMVGILNDSSKHMTLHFKNEGDLIYLIGKPSNDIGCSEYLYNYHNLKHSPAPEFDLEEEFALQNSIKDLIDQSLINSAHDISEGGLFIALIESAMVNTYGFKITTDQNFRKDAYLFGEAQSRVIVSISPDKEESLVSYLESNSCSYSKIGDVTRKYISIDDENFDSINEYKELYNTSLKNLIESQPKKK
ncbi:MAG: phosphoribosylformylglycinamidine synthase subunit PurL [Bacteroidia bacterium]|nr:phosphoribosylformylglycinamidine synthase subunit PurL [Bacteroidia bacterium]